MLNCCENDGNKNHSFNLESDQSRYQVSISFKLWKQG